MIGYCLSNNNEMCYSTKIQTFSRTKHSLCTCRSRQWLSSMHFFNLGMSDRPAYLSADYSVPCSNVMKQLSQFAVLEKKAL